MDNGGNLREGLRSHPAIFNFIVWFIENFSSFDQIQSSLQIPDSSPSLATQQTFFFSNDNKENTHKHAHRPTSRSQVLSWGYITKLLIVSS